MTSRSRSRTRSRSREARRSESQARVEGAPLLPRYRDSTALVRRRSNPGSDGTASSKRARTGDWSAPAAAADRPSARRPAEAPVALNTAASSERSQTSSGPRSSPLCVPLLCCLVLVAGVFGLRRRWGRRTQSTDPSEWTSEDASQWLVNESFPVFFVTECANNDVDGEVLLHMVKDHTFMSGVRERLSALDQMRLQRNLQKLERQYGRPPIGAWSYRKMHRQRAEMLYTGLLFYPRATVLYFYIFEADTLAYFHQKSMPLPFVGWRPPSGGRQFLALGLLAPQLLIAAHAVPFFTGSFWTMYVLVFVSIATFFYEVKFVVDVALGNRRLTMQVVRQKVVEFTTTVARVNVYWFTMWPWIPKSICDLIACLYFANRVVRIASLPVRRIWRGQRLQAAFWALVTALPLVLTDSYLWDAFLYIMINLPGLGAVALARMWVGAMTPDEMQEMFGSLAMFLSPKVVIRIPQSRFLSESVRQVNEIDASKLQWQYPVSVVYADETAAGVVSQEGIDMGGIYRDWLNRCADLLLDEEHGLFEPFTLQGVEMLRLRPGADEGVAKFSGRLLGLSLRGSVPLGWTFCEPLARLLLFPQLPKVLDARDGTEAEKWLDAVGFDAEAWIWPAVGEGEAKWFLDCLDEQKPMAERQLLLQAVLDCPPTESWSSVTLDNLRAFMATRAETELVHNVAQLLRAFWEAFHEVTATSNCILAEAGSSNRRLTVAKARPNDWNRLVATVQGAVRIDVEDWKRNTSVIGAADARVVRWFWDFVIDCSDDERAMLLFWASSMKRLPHRGLGSTGMKMRLNLCAVSDDRLPVAHTCNFQIDLPSYSSSDVLRRKFRLAIGSMTFSLA